MVDLFMWRRYCVFLCLHVCCIRWGANKLALSSVPIVKRSPQRTTTKKFRHGFAFFYNPTHGESPGSLTFCALDDTPRSPFSPQCRQFVFCVYMPNLLTYEGLAEFAIIDVERGIRWVGLVVIFFTFIFYYLIALCYIV